MTHLLRRAGIEVTTLDLDPALGTDLVGSVSKIPLTDESVDVALCAEVLEHLPWADVQSAVRELARVARKGAVISVPDVTPYFGIRLPVYFGTYVNRLRRHGLRGAARMALRREIRWRDLLWLALVPERWSMERRTWEPRRNRIPHRPWALDFKGEHYWELGTLGYPRQRLVEALQAAGFRVVRDFRVPEHPWHHFFVLHRAPLRA